jgi:prepilin-type N-terminal cleavage/methylation domain-containing protein
MTKDRCNKKGFTLIEVLVTLMILAFGMLACVVGIKGALDHSMMNEMRNEAMKIAQEQEEAARSMPYADIAQIPPQTITRHLSKGSVPYNVACTVTPAPNAAANLGASTVQFTVSWYFKTTNYLYNLETIVRQAQ